MSVNSLSPYKEKFCSIISEIVDKSRDVIVESENVLEYDTIELTLLLKSIGFRLFSFEFNEPANDDMNNIEIELKCRRSGLHSKMILQSNKCTCPSRKATNNNSFWEVQGIAPSTPDTKIKGVVVQDTSCNLLPEISKKSARLAKAMLAVLLQNYQMNFSGTADETKSKTLDVKRIIERFQVKDEENNGNKKISRGISVSPSDGPNTLSTKNSHCSTPLSSINVTPTPSYDGSLENIVPKVLVNGPNEVPGEDNSENIKQSENISADTQVQSSGDNMSVKIREKTFDKLSAENEKDICLIKEIQEARKHLDSALLVLKCNITKDTSNSILTVTPQIPKRMSLLSSTKNSSTSSRYTSAVSNRRYSTGSRVDSFRNNSKSQNTKTPFDNKGTELKRRTIGSTSSSSSSLSLIQQKDTQKYTDKSKINIDTKKLSAKLMNGSNNNDYVRPIIRRSSTGSSSNMRPPPLAKSQLTKSVGKILSLVKETKK